MATLFCSIVGAAEGKFDIHIDTIKSVDRLKQAIKAANPDKIQCDADELQLFLAKQGGAWLDGIEAAGAALDKHGHPIGFARMDSILWSQCFEENFQPAVSHVHVLVVVAKGGPVLEDSRKKRRLEYYPEGWIKGIKDSQIAVLPATCKDLKKHLKRELRVKVPVNDRLFMIMSTKNSAGGLSSIMSRIFEAPQQGLGCITASILGAVIDPLWFGFETAEKATYHYFWDSLIAVLLMQISDGNHYRRYSNEYAITGSYQPDLCFYYNNFKNSDICVLRGEEKARGSFSVPIKELHAHLIWKYDPAPYIFGYAAVGRRICLLVITKDETTEHRAKVETIETYDLDKLKGRLQFFLAILNLSTLLRPIANLIPSLGWTEYGVLSQENGVKIELAENSVTKIYPSDMPCGTKLLNLDMIHRRMKKYSVSNVAELIEINLQRRSVTLKPVGLPSEPDSVHELLTALRDILKALAAMHAISVMHRDLKWDNVLKYRGESDKWFLIDFDEAALSPAEQVIHLREGSHAPEIQSSSHTIKVDIWSVGFLLKTSTVQDLPVELERIKTRCLEEDPSSRPTAETLLATIESLLGT